MLETMFGQNSGLGQASESITANNKTSNQSDAPNTH